MGLTSLIPAELLHTEARTETEAGRTKAANLPTWLFSRFAVEDEVPLETTGSRVF